MKIKLTEEVYSNLSDDDKVRLFLLIRDIELHGLIEGKIRQLELLHKPRHQTYLCETDNDKKVVRETRVFISKLISKSRYLNKEWLPCLESVVWYDNLDFIPQNYTFSETQDGYLITIKQLKTASDLSRWITKTWKKHEYQVEKYVEVQPFVGKDKNRKNNLPLYALLNEVTDVLSLKSGKTFEEISEILNKKYHKMNYRTKKTTESMYYRVLDEIDKFLQEKQNFDNLLHKLGLK